MRTRLIALAVLSATALGLWASNRTSSFVYRRADRTMMMSVRGSVPDLNALARKYGGEYAWARQNGREYLVTDPGVLAEIRAALAKLEQVEAPMRAIERRMKPHERDMHALERRFDALSDQLDDEDLPEATRRTLEQKLRTLEQEMRAVEARMEEVEGEMDRVTNNVEHHSAIAERRCEEIMTRAIRNGKAQRIR